MIFDYLIQIQHGKFVCGSTDLMTNHDYTKNNRSWPVIPKTEKIVVILQNYPTGIYFIYVMCLF